MDPVLLQRADTSSSRAPYGRARRKFIDAKSLEPTRLVFIDEAGSHIAMTREYARAPRGYSGQL